MLNAQNASNDLYALIAKHLGSKPTVEEVLAMADILNPPG